jgi:hypothetical protein
MKAKNIQEKDFHKYLEVPEAPEDVEYEDLLTYEQAIEIAKKVSDNDPDFKFIDELKEKAAQAAVEWREGSKGGKGGKGRKEGERPRLPKHDKKSFTQLVCYKYLYYHSLEYKNYIRWHKEVDVPDEKGRYFTRTIYGQYPTFYNGAYPKTLTGIRKYCQDIYGPHSPRLYSHWEKMMNTMGRNYVDTRDDATILREIWKLRVKDSEEIWGLNRPRGKIKVGDECTIVQLDLYNGSHSLFAYTKRIETPPNVANEDLMFIDYDNGVVPWIVTTGFPYASLVSRDNRDFYPAGVRISAITREDVRETLALYEKWAKY